jgi:epoxyqueuosine reductase QueG
LPKKQTRHFSNAILIGIALSKDFLKKVTHTPDYVKDMIRNNNFDDDEFLQKETKADRLADYIAGYLASKGYSAYSQSEEHNWSTGIFDEKTKTSPLPHKTIAGLAGLGWIGKHNLLVTHEFGSAVCMCTVLTDAPFTTVSYPPETSRCGNCRTYRDICSVNAIKGNTWSITTSRDELVDVYACMTCLECLVFCPWTQKYMNENTEQ